MTAAERRDPRVAALLTLRGIASRTRTSRCPGKISGGQRQRSGSPARWSLLAGVIVARRAGLALDVSVRAQIINLLEDLQARLGVAYVFISA